MSILKEIFNEAEVGLDALNSVTKPLQDEAKAGLAVIEDARRDAVKFAADARRDAVKFAAGELAPVFDQTAQPTVTSEFIDAAEKLRNETVDDVAYAINNPDAAVEAIKSETKGFLARFSPF